MLIKGMVKECDHTGMKYPDYVEGAWAIAQGATGRWCTVLHYGPEFIKQQNLEGKLLTYEQALRMVELKGGWADF